MTGAASGGGVSLRLFTALQVPAEHADQLADHAEALASRFPEARAVDPATIHVTWAFLGRVPEEHVPAIVRLLEAAASEVPGPTLCSLGTVGAFGHRHVVGADVELELLTPLDAARDQFIAEVAPWAVDVDRRPWHPHVSLLRSRTKERLPRELLDAAHPAPDVRWVATTLCLYASLPAPGGTQHRILHAVPLGTAVPMR